MQFATANGLYDGAARAPLAPLNDPRLEANWARPVKLLARIAL
jgi:hypothetical protein